MLTTALNFNGKAEEAINFYANIFGYELKENDIYRWENGLIAHAEITIYEKKLMLADVDFDNDSFAGFSLSINLTDESELKKIYDALSNGADIIMPLQKVEWSQYYGLLKDKFGITWQFNLD